MKGIQPYNELADELASLELILLAKQKGLVIKSNNWNTPFYVLTDTRYFKKYELTEVWIDETCCDNHPVKKNFRLYTAPQTLIQKWLRDTHNIYVEVTVNDRETFIGNITTFIYGKKINTSLEHDFPTYEIALEKTIFIALKSI